MSREPRTPARAPDLQELARGDENRFQRLVESTPAAMFVVRGDKALYANPAMVLLTGHRAVDLAELRFWDLVHPDHRELVEGRAQKGEDVPRFLEVKLLTATGEERWVHYSATVVELDGAPAIVGNAVPVASTRSREEPRSLLDPAAQRLRKLESLEMLAGGLAHDLNNLLTGILGSASLAAMKVPSDSPAAEQLERVLDAAGKAARLTKQMLGYAGASRLRRTPTAIDSILEELLPEIRRCLEPRIELRLDVGCDLPPIDADPILLRQAVLNLLANSVEAMEQGTGEILVRAGTEAASVPVASPPVFLEVRDDGPGMDEQTRSRIFEPFFTTRGPGRGVGLTAVLGIVRSHGGTVRVASAPRRGTTVTLSFPAAGQPEAFRSPERRSGTILVVDDEDSVRGVARSILEESGYQVLTASDGDAAIALFDERACDIDAVLLDVTIPPRNGAETMAALRRRSPDVRVVVASGYGRERLGPELLDGGCGFLQKPFEPRDLIERIEEALAPPGPSDPGL